MKPRRPMLECTPDGLQRACVGMHPGRFTARLRHFSTLDNYSTPAKPNKARSGGSQKTQRATTENNTRECGHWKCIQRHHKELMPIQIKMDRKQD
ncbi:unnamed protein product [Lota lota]